MHKIEFAVLWSDKILSQKPILSGQHISACDMMQFGLEIIAGVTSMQQMNKKRCNADRSIAETIKAKKWSVMMQHKELLQE